MAYKSDCSTKVFHAGLRREMTPHLPGRRSASGPPLSYGAAEQDTGANVTCGNQLEAAAGRFRFSGGCVGAL